MNFTGAAILQLNHTAIAISPVAAYMDGSGVMRYAFQDDTVALRACGLLQTETHTQEIDALVPHGNSEWTLVPTALWEKVADERKPWRQADCFCQLPDRPAHANRLLLGPNGFEFFSEVSMPSSELRSELFQGEDEESWWAIGAHIEYPEFLRQAEAIVRDQFKWKDEEEFQAYWEDAKPDDAAHVWVRFLYPLTYEPHFERVDEEHRDRFGVYPATWGSCS